MITLDTSGLLALFDSKDPFHTACVQACRSAHAPLIIPAPILAEIGWFLEDRRRFPQQQLHMFLADIVTGAYKTEWTRDTVARIAFLVERYDDLPLGIADAAVIACAELHGGYVLTTDGHFSQVVARDPKIHITVLPERSGDL